MTASELKYLITVNDLNEQGCGTKMTAVAKKLHVSKVSVYRAVERLIANKYLEQTDKRIVLTDTGKNTIAEIIPIVDFIEDKLVRHCKTPKEIAFDEAVTMASALGESSRNGVMHFINNDGKVNV